MEEDDKNPEEEITEENSAEESPKKEEIAEEDVKKENTQLKMVFFIIGGILIVFLVSYFFIQSLSSFEHQGVDFKIVKEGSLIFYNTAFPLNDAITGKYLGEYNFYIRNDPRKLEKEVAFEGELNLMNNIVLNSTDSFNCDGDGVIAIANLASLFKRVDAEVIKDENATCDEQGRYTYILLQKGNETKVEQVGKSCYTIDIHDCEILKGTERFMLEIFVKMNE